MLNWKQESISAFVLPKMMQYSQILLWKIQATSKILWASRAPRCNLNFGSLKNWGHKKELLLYIFKQDVITKLLCFVHHRFQCVIPGAAGRCEFDCLERPSGVSAIPPRPSEVFHAQLRYVGIHHSLRCPYQHSYHHVQSIWKLSEPFLFERAELGFTRTTESSF